MVIGKAKTYKRAVARRYLPVSAKEIVSKVREADKYYLSTKFDGHLYILSYENKKASLINHFGTVLDDLPLLKEAEELLQKAGIDKAYIPGELYLQQSERTYVFDLVAALDDKSKEIAFAAFDILSIDDQEYDLKNWEEKLTKLDELFPGNGSVHSVGSKTVESRKDIVDFYKQVVETDGQEGVIVKSSEGMIYKVKPLHTFDAVIVGYVEGDGDRKGMLREVLIAMMKDKKTYQIVGKIGNGFSDKERKDLLAKLRPMVVESNYIASSGAKVAFTMVKPEMVVEFTALDVVPENSKGAIKKMSLTFDNTYEAAFLLPCISFMTSVFVKVRDDKNGNNPEDVRFEQITNLVEIDNESNDEKVLEPSTLLERKVFAKESKGSTMIRKFLLWKTNKEQSEDYPAYVFHYTDFSPSRKDKLKVDLKASSSQKQILEIFKNFLEKNVKKGLIEQ